ncbi:ABC transporter substrate-binding protein [Rhodobacter veldkampii DSM 11550]|uniref:ABC transporter substrate-binding protein n=2 Tax=Phaeovulum veldkampii TaxID=33049 RepID=A0A2T4JJT5_9RHOB|nr:extracellular solute-binding protein [Phaeovulum veldkampii]MBK5945047.1 ABC transporter substrate-binding protein [Phaeovulum veldkampii DSM 11550]PTE18145.1 ABC transporter substrate-binding protein [Phaeovulum veldkampii DSM 11550]
MQGEPALGPGFSHLPYANPDAPKGGTIRLGESGGFDSLNPWVLKGRAAAGIAAFTVESLMGRSQDEPFTLYGLLAESVTTDTARSWVEFTLREEAQFSDGAPVTIEDVIWSYETLGTQGHPRYRTAWAKVAKIEQTGPRSLRLTFTEPDRELALLMGLRPVLKKAQWQGRDFDATTLDAPIGSGPYVVAEFEPGRFIRLKRNPDWWGKDLPFNRGQHNFDEIRYDYFGDAGIVFEAFKAGELSSWRETNAAAWARDYGFAAVTSGRVVKSEIPHARPSGITGLVFNTRKPIFADWRVREALILAFNFEFINATLNAGAEPRIASYFSNSALAAGPGPATGRVADLLAPFVASLPPGTLEGYTLPVGDGTEINRANMRRAIKLLEEAGWSVENGILKDVAGNPFRFEIVLAQGAAEVQSIVDIYIESLKRLGIVPVVTTVDDAQYSERSNSYDFDMAWYARALSLSPGNEQTLYWGARGVTEPGSRNWMGVNSPAAEAMIAHLLAATDPAEFTAAVQALDRVLTAGRYVIPIWYAPVSRIAHGRNLHFPPRTPLYGDWPGFQPDVWWYEAEK